MWSWPVFFLWVTKVLANERRFYMYNTFSDWLRLYSASDRNMDPGLMKTGPGSRDANECNQLSSIPILLPFVLGIHQSLVALALCAGNPPATGGFPAQRASNHRSPMRFPAQRASNSESVSMSCVMKQEGQWVHTAVCLPDTFHLTSFLRWLDIKGKWISLLRQADLTSRAKWELTWEVTTCWP